MASFLLTNVVTTPQSLGSAEIGQITATGGIASGGVIALAMTGSSTLQNLGVIMSNTTAISLASTSTYTIQLGATSQIISGGSAIAGSNVGNGFSLANAGTITAAASAIFVSSAGTSLGVMNSGTIESGGGGGPLIALDLTGAGGRISFNNTGTIAGNKAGTLIDFSAVDLTRIVNSGEIITGGFGGEAIIARFGKLFLTNTGEIDGRITAAQGLGLINTGVITGDVAFSGSGRIVNTGTIGFIKANGGSQLFYDGRQGTVIAGIELAGGNDTLIVDDADITITDPGSGIIGGTDLVISSVSFALAQNLENLTLSGAGNTSGTGNSGENVLNGNAGDNVLRGLAGNDAIFGGEGDNRLHGGTGNDVLRGGDGNDDVVGGAGDDTLTARGAGDTMTGGAGVDTLDLGPVQAGVSVNLGGKVATIATGGRIVITGLENIFGTNFDDSLTGSDDDNVLSGDSGNDTLSGGIGNDSLFGDLGNDSLSGGAGNDTLRGGQGQDVLSGGPGTDVFVFGATSESAALTADQITGFATGDLIDLGAIDAVAGGVDDAFVFVGTAAFAGTGPQIRFSQDAGVTTIEIRLSGSVANDMVIALDGLVALTADSLLL